MPGAQGAQAALWLSPPAFAPALPAGQAVQFAAPPAEKVPGAHRLEAAVAFVSGQARPGRQGTQSTAPASATVPRAQAVPASTVASGQAKPGAHSVQLPLPSTA